MSKFNNEIYEKSYNDGFSDAINNLELEDILEYGLKLSEEKKQKIIRIISDCK